MYVISLFWRASFSLPQDACECHFERSLLGSTFKISMNCENSRAGGLCRRHGARRFLPSCCPNSDLMEFVQTGPAPSDSLTATNNGEADLDGGEPGLAFWATPRVSGFVNGVFREIGQMIRGIKWLPRLGLAYPQVRVIPLSSFELYQAP